MRVVESNEEFVESLERMRYRSSFPLGRFLMNRLRKKKGLPPLR